MEWVLKSTDAELISDIVIFIELSDTHQAEIHLESGEVVIASAVIVTGFGSSSQSTMPNCLTMDNFWRTPSKDQRFFGKRVVLIGGGETSASIARCLVERTIPAELTIVSPLETVYSRGESFLENSRYTNPKDWTRLSESQRRDFIRRTDRAVYSQGVQNVLTSRGSHTHVSGRIIKVNPTSDGSLVFIQQEDGVTSLDADFVIDARGGNPLWFFPLLGERLAVALQGSSGDGGSLADVERKIQFDLSMEGAPFPLYIPNAAALSQGPGFPNLSALGRIASRIVPGASNSLAEG